MHIVLLGSRDRASCRCEDSDFYGLRGRRELRLLPSPTGPRPARTQAPGAFVVKCSPRHEGMSRTGGESSVNFTASSTPPVCSRSRALKMRALQVWLTLSIAAAASSTVCKSRSASPNWRRPRRMLQFKFVMPHEVLRDQVESFNVRIESTHPSQRLPILGLLGKGVSSGIGKRCSCARVPRLVEGEEVRPTRDDQQSLHQTCGALALQWRHAEGASVNDAGG